MKRTTGTREWSVASANCIAGCPNRCRYCYAAYNAVRSHLCPNREAWGTTYHQLTNNVNKVWPKYDGVVMFPTQHDITPEFLDPCIRVLGNLLAAGNEVLVVSKPSLSCIRKICETYTDYKDKILFRFSIGAANDWILNYWEPHAPNFGERFSALKYASQHGFKTSISCEPLLDSVYVDAMVDMLTPYVTDSIWIGKCNNLRQRCTEDTPEWALRLLEACQTDSEVTRVYNMLKDHPLIRWKDSYREILGLDKPRNCGILTV